MIMEKSLQKVEPAETALSSTLAVIERAAGNKEIDVDKMERLLQMQERILAKQAESEFNEAMQRVQQEIPRILRDATNPSTNSKYARLESLLKVVVPIYTAFGFSLSFGTSDCHVPGHYRIVCDVAHKGMAGSFTRHYQCDIPADTTGMKGTLNKTATHGFGSTMSYGRRYLTLLIFNIALINEDNDGDDYKKPSGPSTMRPPTSELKPLAQELWDLLKPVRGTKQDWAESNRWLWKMEFLDGAVPEEAPHLTAEKFREVIKKVKARIIA